MMKRENLILDSLCFRIFILNLRKWALQGEVGPQPVFERDFPMLSLAEAPTKFEDLRMVLLSTEIEVENLQVKYNNNMVPVGARESFFPEAELLGIGDIYGHDSPMETLFSFDIPQLVPMDRLYQVLRKYQVSNVFVTTCETDPAPNSSGWFATVNDVEYYTETHLPESERFIPAGYAIVGH